MKKHAIKKWIFAFVLVLTALFPFDGSAQSKAELVGTWKLVSATEITKKGKVRGAFGWQNPTGLITYTADGRMMALITSGARKPLSVSDFVAAPGGERAEAFATMTAYAGSYTVNGNKVIHHLEVCALQNQVNTELVRLITKLDRDSLVLRTANMGSAGPDIAYREFAWERISSGSAP
jgi:hypothetical protein